MVQVPKPTHSVLGIEMDKIKAIQTKIEDFVKHMSELLAIERDAELEFTQEELSAVPKPDEKSNSTKPTEYLVSHGQAQQEQCDTLCNLNAISSSTGDSNTFLVSAFIHILNYLCFIINLHFIKLALYAGIYLSSGLGAAFGSLKFSSHMSRFDVIYTSTWNYVIVKIILW